MPLDLTLAPLYRINGMDQASLPGLMAAMPPRKTARGRERDRLIVYLLLTGNAVFSTGEYVQLASRAAATFFETHGTLTSALRIAAEAVNKSLLERNMSTSGRGQYANGALALAAARESQITFLFSGPVHAFVLSAASAQDISDSLAGKGLGLNAALTYHFSQAALQAGDRVIFASHVPTGWDSALRDTSAASLDSTRRRLMTITNEDLNAALLYAAEGTGTLTVLRPTPEPAPVKPQPAAPPVVDASSLRQALGGVQGGASLSAGLSRAAAQEVESTPETDSPNSIPNAHMVQPSAYAIPPEPKEETPPPEERIAPSSNILDSLPRAKPIVETTSAVEQKVDALQKESPAPGSPSERTRQTAKTLANGMQSWRQGRARMDQGLRNFLPRLLPGSEDAAMALSNSTMAFIAILIPLVVVTIASVVYFRYGRSVQYEEYLVQAREARAQVQGISDPAAQREAWQRELFYLDKAESYNQTAETQSLRQEAQSNLDKLQGIARLQFQPVLDSGVGVQISRLAANENDLYLLDAQHGSVLHIALTSGGFQRDSSFNCSPGSYGAYSVGPLVDILALPINNSLNAALLGVDAAGNLLYCSSGNVPQAIPLPPPDTNWKRVTSFTMDSGNLYVLDSRAHAVWVYVGKDGAFVDRPYFFFGGQIPSLDDAIDLAVSGDDLYILHSDGHLSTCSYSRIQTVPTRCVDPAPLVNPFPAYKDVNLFSQAHFTQMMFTPAPDSALLLLDSDGQGVFRFAPLSLELQSQLRPQTAANNPLPPGRVGAMTVSPNHVLYFAVQDKVYFAANLP